MRDRKPLPVFEEILSQSPTGLLLSTSYMDITLAAKNAVEDGADVNAKDKSFGNTPLMNAASNNNISLLKFLLGKGASVNTKNDVDETALMKASYYGSFPIVKTLIDKGADVNASDADGNTALHHAIMGGRKEVATYLIGKGLDVNKKNRNKSTPLHLTLAGDDTRLAKYLISKGAKVDSLFKDRVKGLKKTKLQALLDEL